VLLSSDKKTKEVLAANIPSPQNHHHKTDPEWYEKREKFIVLAI